jgi:hypothetical protein
LFAEICILQPTLTRAVWPDLAKIRHLEKNTMQIKD